MRFECINSFCPGKLDSYNKDGNKFIKLNNSFLKSLRNLKKNINKLQNEDFSKLAIQYNNLVNETIQSLKLLPFEIITKEENTTNENLENFTFIAKPTIDEKSQCPKCKSWCEKKGSSSKDILIRTIDILFKQVNEKPLSEMEYRKLIKLDIEPLKTIISEIENRIDNIKEEHKDVVDCLKEEHKEAIQSLNNELEYQFKEKKNNIVNVILKEVFDNGY